MGGYRRRRGFAIAVVVVGLAAVVYLVVHLSISRSPATRHPSASNSTATASPSGSTGYRTLGNQIIGPDGRSFLPYGITVFGLAYPHWQQRVSSDEDQIRATAQYWHGNTVRLMIAPTNLLQNNLPDNRHFMRAIRREVSTAESYGLNVILTAQYERTTKLRMPDSSTLRFWRILAARYKGDDRVWFDL
ncbi:MAG TPA: cellulase family glycosylhydrolase, partial [Acidimicrobiales bacterium]|nr:cellulase family glycosylhydrolase [Acidimicrobiales bacterium]